MRLKEIKPGMVIHCKNDEEKKALLEEAEKLGYVWYRTKHMPTDYISSAGNTIYFYGAGTTPLSANYKYIVYSCSTNDVTTEFSDLILPELTAEEALLAYDQMCKENYCCNDCPIYKIMGDECIHKMEGHISEIVDAIKQWKSDHEKKEPEIETVDICRIIEIQPDGRKRCVHEIDLNPYGEMLFKEQIEEILKRYCMEHEGEFIAVHEVVSRVKK